MTYDIFYNYKKHTNGFELSSPRICAYELALEVSTPLDVEVTGPSHAVNSIIDGLDFGLL